MFIRRVAGCCDDFVPQWLSNCVPRASAGANVWERGAGGVLASPSVGCTAEKTLTFLCEFANFTVFRAVIPLSYLIVSEMLAARPKLAISSFATSQVRREAEKLSRHT